jgi:uncharacterized protein
VAERSEVPGMYAARPTITVDSAERPALGEGLVDLFVEETTAGLCRAEATFANWGPTAQSTGYLYFDRSVIEFGKAFVVEAGAGSAAGTIFDGRISGIEGRYLRERPPQVLVYAEDRLQDLRMTRRTRTFTDLSDGDLFQQIASQHGLQSDVDVSGPTHKILAQVNQSDLALVRERARAIDAEVWVVGRTLHVQSRGRRQAGDVSLTYGSGLLEFTVTADLASQASGFTVTGWDVAGKQKISHRAAASVISGEAGNDRTGSGILDQAFGTREQQVVHALPLTTDEAQAEAEAYYRRSARRFVSGSGVAGGDARVQVGTRLSLDGLGALFDGRYHVTRVRHSFDLVHGFRTAFDVERPGIAA